MKIAVMGAGALGGYFGGRLAQAGHEVTLIARGAHLDALRRHGLRIQSPNGNAHLPKIAATGDPGEVGAVDTILFMVKNIDVEAAGAAIKPMLGPETMVVTCQNGVTAWERLGAVIGARHVVPGVARIPGHIAEPGVIAHTAPFDMLSFGEADGGISPRCEMLAEALTQAGTTPLLHDAILIDLWTKFCGQATMASFTTLTGLDLGPLRDTAASRDLMRAAVEEAFDVARAVQPAMPKDTVAKIWSFLESLPDHMHASMLDDLRNGKPLEHEYLGGDLVRLGARHGVPTPIHSVFYAALKPIADALLPR
ncbi:2-dehydropantoate 2-reductase [Marinovum sp.]|uniref:2-dehydropantoate 2-reductase n=1 Tax=Marinovum sp. TaxID=2024839 RepID=UPI002B26799B|nr:2-dehydropantoate 2-reductase [Marinovum sp.]